MRSDMTLTESQQAWIDDLRAMTDFLEAHPSLIQYAGFQNDQFAYDPDEMAALTREMGTSAKFEKGRWIGLRRTFGEHHIDVNIASNLVCERVQVGTEKATKIVAQDMVPEGARVIEAVPTVRIEVEEPVYETRCPESFLASN